MTLRDRKILIVDDDFVGRKKIEATVQRYGSCCSTSDGELAFDLFTKAHFRGRPFALITMDIEMPGMNGLDTMRAIRDWEEENLDEDEDAAVRVIVVSGRNESDSVLSAFSCKCENFITKPITHAKLSNAMHELGFDKIR